MMERLNLAQLILHGLAVVAVVCFVTVNNVQANSTASAGNSDNSTASNNSQMLMPEVPLNETLQILTRPEFLQDFKVSSLGKNDANLTWSIDFSGLMMDVGLQYLVSLREGSDSNCSQFVTWRKYHPLTGLKSNTNYSVSILPFCSGGSPFFDMPEQPPKFKNGVNQSCDSTDSCYKRSSLLSFHTL